jgi:hypothetical protein
VVPDHFDFSQEVSAGCEPQEDGMKNNSMMKALPRIVLTIAASASLASAAPIMGMLNIAGSITVSNANNGTIIFDPITGIAGTPTFDVIASTGSFQVLGGDTGTESTSLNGTNEPVGMMLTPPVTGFLNIPAGALTFDLTEVLAATASTQCTATTSSGSCFIPNAPYNFNSGSGGASATFSVLGNLHYMGQTVNNVTLQYSATFVGETIGQVISAYQSSGSSVQSSDAELMVVVTPEPSTSIMLAMGAGLLGLSVFLKRRRAIRQ